MRKLKKIAAATGLAAVALAAPAAASTASANADSKAKTTHVTISALKSKTDTWPI